MRKKALRSFQTKSRRRRRGAMAGRFVTRGDADAPKGAFAAFLAQASMQQKQKHHANSPNTYSHFCACAETRSLSAWLKKCIFSSNMKSFKCHQTN
jgi:hypothetical protein